MSRLNTRTVLVRQLQDFFEKHLGGVFSWYTAGDHEDPSAAPPNSIRLRPAEMHPKIPGKRQLERGVATVDFGGYALMLHSPEEAPPIGKVVLFHPDHGSLEGPLDVVTWTRIAEAIKSTVKKGQQNVS